MDVQPSPADILIAELRGTQLRVSNVDDDEYRSEQKPDELEEEWTNAIHSRYGVVQSEPSASSKSAPKRRSSNQRDNLGEAESLGFVRRLISSEDIDLALGVEGNDNNDNDDPDVPLKSYINPSNHRVLSEMKDGRTIAIGYSFRICLIMVVLLLFFLPVCSMMIINLNYIIL